MERKILFIGRNDPMKGSEFLSQLALAMPEYEFGWIGSGSEIKGVKQVAGFVSLTPEYMEQIANDYDFFISPSLADPNPTTILECMAWGFPTLCTLQSGYYQSEILTNIFSDDLEKTKLIITKYQTMEESELIKISEEGRKYVTINHNWERFTQTISSTILQLYDQK